MLVSNPLRLLYESINQRIELLYYRLHIKAIFQLECVLSVAEGDHSCMRNVYIRFLDTLFKPLNIVIAVHACVLSAK